MSSEQKTQEAEKKSSRAKIVVVLLLTLILAAAAGVGFYFVWRNTNYVATDNARVTTTLIPVAPTMAGTLERFTVYEGRFVKQNEILGWVENDEAMRSPVNGLVIFADAVQNQTVSPTEPVAVIADTGKIHIQANIEESYIQRIRVGQAVSVTIDPFGSRQFSGYVSEIGKVTAAELSGSALFFNTGGNFTRITHLIPLKINITDDVNLSRLIGVNARVRISLKSPAVNHGERLSSEPLNVITARGTVESVETQKVYATLGYTLKRVFVEAGDRVTKRQILGVLDTVDLAAAANLRLVEARALLRTAEISLATAKYNYEIRQTLYGRGAVVRDEMRQAEFALQSATAARQEAQEALNATRVFLKRQRENSIIRAPANGVVTSVFAKEGTVGAGLLFVIEDTDKLKVTAKFREYDIGRIKTGMEVTITSDATGAAAYRGVISRINPAAVKGAGGETAHTPVVEFEAEVTVTSENTSLRIGSNARLDIVLNDN
jgi:multidrug resistance efflux pump